MQAEPSTNASSAPILPLTSVRFLAAFYVVLHHSNMWRWHMDSSTLLGRFLRNGFVAVSFFFVLSGFILAFVYLDTNRPFNRRAFWTARFARAYPLLLASIILDIPNLLRTASGKQVLFSLVSGAALLQAWAFRFRLLNPPSWSLSAEAFFYLVFPFVALPIVRRKGNQALLTLTILCLAAMAVPIVITLRDPSLFTQQPASRLQTAVELSPVLRLFEFLSGIALCAVYRSFRIDSRRAHLFLISAIFLFLLVIAFANHLPSMAINAGILIPVFSLAILGLANLRGPLASLLAHPAPVLLGEASYAVYLLHGPLGVFLSVYFPTNSVPLYLAFVALLLALSIASFLLLERPARRAILRLAAVRPRITLNQESAAKPATLR